MSFARIGIIVAEKTGASTKRPPTRHSTRTNDRRAGVAGSACAGSVDASRADEDGMLVNRFWV